MFWFFFWMNIDFYLIGIKRFIEYMDYVYFKYWMSIYFKNMRIVFFEIKERFFSFIIWRYIVYIKKILVFIFYFFREVEFCGYWLIFGFNVMDNLLGLFFDVIKEGYSWGRVVRWIGFCVWYGVVVFGRRVFYVGLFWVEVR